MVVCLDKSQLLYVASRSEWRSWLQQHYQSQKEVWLVYYKKHTGKSRISYNDAVVEALCFGWIDSTVRRVDADRYAQRFSLRNPKSSYSPANQQRLRSLIEHGLVAPDILPTLANAIQSESSFVVPPDILEKLQANPVAWENFKKLSPTYIYLRISFIEGARSRPPEFNRRLSHFIKMTEKNKLFGFGGIGKYY